MGVIQGPVTSSIERHFPVNGLSALVRVERPDLARPALYLHKWWAGRFGSVFRSIILAASLPPGENAWDHHYQHTDFGGNIILDPFMGGGTTVFEALRLGCKVVGCDLYAEYRYGANFRQYREHWRSQALDELCRYLAEVTGDTVYDKIVEAAF